MRITFVTKSHTTYDETKTVNVAKQEEVEDISAQLDDLTDQMRKLNKRLNALDAASGKVDERLRKDCRKIFSDVIEDALRPVFSILEQVVKKKSISVDSVETSKTDDPVPKTAARNKTAQKTNPKQKATDSTKRKTQARRVPVKTDSRAKVRPASSKTRNKRK